MSNAREFNFDGLVGPTYNYAGLAYGNLASMHSGGNASNPRQAALEGLSKMRLLMEWGIGQVVLPPQERPHWPTLRRLGFSGSEREIAAQVRHSAPELLAAVSSASSMWAANAATVSPGVDTADGCLHLTPANLISHLHRALEASQTHFVLRSIFPNDNSVRVHTPLPAAIGLGDEGAANHLRLAPSHGAAGIEIFVNGRDGMAKIRDAPNRYPGRQTLQAGQAIARLHGLSSRRIFFVRQNPALIDQGVFHNDVIGVSNENVLFCHEQAFADGPGFLVELHRRYRELCGADFIARIVASRELNVAEAVETYLFNSQIVSLPAGGMALIAPQECEAHPRTQRIIAGLLADESIPIHTVHYVNVRQSMRNGGGPACLRLRMVLTDLEAAGLHPGVVLTPDLYERLNGWVQNHYRSRLMPEDLADPALVDETRTALDELSSLLGLGSIYEFQR